MQAQRIERGIYVSTISLPQSDSSGFCHLILSALGGDGANAMGKLLFQIAVEQLGLDGAYDARYGSEKTGTATDVSLRLCPLGTPVRESGPTQEPHILGVFRQNLIRRLRLNRGLRANATVLVNTENTPEGIRDQLELHSGVVTCVPASALASETGCRLNIPMLAVAARALGFPAELVRNSVERTWPAAREKNLAAFDQALERSVTQGFPADGNYPLAAADGSRGPIGYKNMLNGGVIDARCWLSSAMAPLPGTGSIPAFYRDLCTDCGLCLVVCSDPGAVVWKDKKMVGIDDAYCKGCLRCVEVCPATRRGRALQASARMR